jgi:hypothetical protein
MLIIRKWWYSPDKGDNLTDVTAMAFQKLNNRRLPSPEVERDGLWVERNSRATNLALASPAITTDASRKPSRRQSLDSDFGSTVAGVAGNVLEWYDFAGT